MRFREFLEIAGHDPEDIFILFDVRDSVDKSILEFMKVDECIEEPFKVPPTKLSEDKMKIYESILDREVLTIIPTYDVDPNNYDDFRPICECNIYTWFKVLLKD